MTVKTISYQEARELMTPESEKIFLRNAREIAEAGTLTPGINHVQMYILDPATNIDTKKAISTNLALNIELLKAMGKEAFTRFASENHGMYLYISFAKAERLERDECILEDYARGLTSAQIAIKFHLTPACVRKIRQRNKDQRL